MLEKPSLAEDRITACLDADFGVHVAAVEFLPLGADPNSAVYRADAGDSRAAYFVKLRRGPFDEIAVKVPRYLSDHGLAAVIPPAYAQSGRLWANLEEFTVTLYPFVHGRTATEVPLSENQWIRFGAAMKTLHTTAWPADLAALVPRETYSPKGRDQVRNFLRLAEEVVFQDPVATRLAAFLTNEREQIIDLLVRAEHLAATLHSDTQQFVVCHSDVHANNLLIDDESDRLFIVDWDEPIYALKERDLMFIGGAQRFAGYEPSEERELFYRGYGETVADDVALAYHRYERIVQDIAAYCDQLLLHHDRAADREPAYERVKSNFVTGGTLDQARRADATLGSSSRF